MISQCPLARAVIRAAIIGAGAAVHSAPTRRGRRRGRIGLDLNKFGFEARVGVGMLSAQQVLFGGEVAVDPDSGPHAVAGSMAQR